MESPNCQSYEYWTIFYFPFSIFFSFSFHFYLRLEFNMMSWSQVSQICHMSHAAVTVIVTWSHGYKRTW